MVVDHSTIFNKQKLLLLLPVSEQPRCKLGVDVLLLENLLACSVQEV
jgi:hypothetical protein